MMRFVGLLLLMIAPLTASAAPLAELFGTRTSDGVLLHGLHYSPRNPSTTAVIHLPGGPGAFYSIQDMAPLAQSLQQADYHFFTVNTRTAGTNGMMYARFEDYEKDVAAAVQYALGTGMKDIILLGQSLGSVRAVYYTAMTGDTAIKALILCSAIPSPYLEAQARRDADQRQAYDEFLAKQRKKIANRQGLELSAWPWWGNERLLNISAAAWVSVFGAPAESNASTVKFAGKIELPVLMVHGTRDEVVRPALAEQVLAAFSKSSDRHLVTIEGANHLFLGHEAELASVVTDWLVKRFPHPVVSGE